MTVEMDTERTRARHRDKTQDVFAEESEALDQIAKQVINCLQSAFAEPKASIKLKHSFRIRVSKKFKKVLTEKLQVYVHIVCPKMSQMKS